MWLFAPSGVALEFNAHIPVVGTCIRAFQNIYVPRSSHGSAAKPAAGGPRSKSVSDLVKERSVADTTTSLLALGCRVLGFDLLSLAGLVQGKR